MTGKKSFLSLIGLVCLVAGVAFALLGIGSKTVAYLLIAVGALLFFGPIVGVRRIISLIVIAALSVIAYHAVLYLLSVFGIFVQSSGKTAIFIISVLFVYILSSSSSKRT